MIRSIKPINNQEFILSASVDNDELGLEILIFIGENKRSKYIVFPGWNYYFEINNWKDVGENSDQIAVQGGFLGDFADDIAKAVKKFSTNAYVPDDEKKRKLRKKRRK